MWRRDKELSWPKPSVKGLDLKTLIIPFCVHLKHEKIMKIHELCYVFVRNNLVSLLNVRTAQGIQNGGQNLYSKGDNYESMTIGWVRYLFIYLFFFWYGLLTTVRRPVKFFVSSCHFLESLKHNVRLENLERIISLHRMVYLSYQWPRSLRWKIMYLEHLLFWNKRGKL